MTRVKHSLKMQTMVCATNRWIWSVRWGYHLSSRMASECRRICTTGERDMDNNHGTWFDGMWQGVALYVGNTTQASDAAVECCKVHMEFQLAKDGSQWLELERSNPAGYCQYNLRAFSENARLAANAGLYNVWSYKTVTNGSSIADAIDFLLPYALGEKPWPYPNIDSVSWGSLWPVLRSASVALKNKKYEEAACKLYKAEAAWGTPLWVPHTAAGTPSTLVATTLSAHYETDILNLFEPPIYDVTC
eukprot:m.365328 g.365328  ORF g.365328 m.365328 type:complete len:247 (+) comp20814_c2_seq7:1413-2153(+)